MTDSNLFSYLVQAIDVATKKQQLTQSVHLLASLLVDDLVTEFLSNIRVEVSMLAFDIEQAIDVLPVAMEIEGRKAQGTYGFNCLAKLVEQGERLDDELITSMDLLEEIFHEHDSAAVTCLHNHGITENLVQRYNSMTVEDVHALEALCSDPTGLSLPASTSSVEIESLLRLLGFYAGHNSFNKITCEMILFGLLFNHEVADSLNLDSDKLVEIQQRLEKYIREKEVVVLFPVQKEVYFDQRACSVLLRMSIHCLILGRGITGEDVLLAILLEKDGFAAKVLRENGIHHTEFYK